MTTAGMDMTIGEFSMLSGLTPKALRLYEQRGILTPAATDPASGYRWYSAEQIRHGQTLWALREGGVPLADLTDIDAFDIEDFQRRLEMRRLMEDAALRIALAYRSISLTDWPVHAAAAGPQPWVGTSIDITMDDDTDPPSVFFALPATFERHRAALRAGLATCGAAQDGPWWMTTGRPTDGGTPGVRMYVCVPTVSDRCRRDRDFLTGVHAAVGDAAVVGGVLPARLEVSCTADVDYGDEQAAMAAGLAPRLAIDAYIRDRGHRPLSPHTRELHSGPLGTSAPVVVRDVEPGAATRS